MKQPNWTRILTILLVILASYAVLYIAASMLFRFTQAIFLFVLGAITAYVLTPLVNRLEVTFRVRWLAVFISYGLIAVGLFALGVLLFTPFVQQAQSLVDNLHNPSPGSLRTIVQVQKDTDTVRHDIKIEREAVAVIASVPPTRIVLTKADIAKVQRDIVDLKNGTVSGISHTAPPISLRGQKGVPPNPQPQTQVPPGYIQQIEAPVKQLTSTYSAATQDPANVDAAALGRAATLVKKANAAAKTMYNIMSTTPILLLRSQTWLDQHGLHVDLHSKFGDAASQISNQGSSILDNAITILSTTANTLLNITLILIISFYLLNDGGRLLHRGVVLVPEKYREQAWFFLTSLDSVLGGYIRGQLFLSLLAGILGGGGAAFLGVPYPLLIGIMTFLLQMIPVIGPLVAVVPAVAISLFFMPPLTTAILALWFVVFQQIVTNVLGPRIMGMAVGIHPLEALLAVLVGYPLGGFLGAFLAVPLAGIVHILVRELYAYFVLGQELPSATVPVSASTEEEYEEVMTPKPAAGRTTDSAAS